MRPPQPDINTNSNERDDSGNEDEDVFEKLRQINKEATEAAKTAAAAGEKDISDAFDKLKQNRSIHKSKKANQDGDINDVENQTYEQPIRDASNLRKRIRAVEDSEDDDEVPTPNVGKISDDEETGNNLPVKHHSRHIIHSDSEEEAGNENGNTTNALEEDVHQKRTRSTSDSESEKPTAKRSRILDSDDE